MKINPFGYVPALTEGNLNVFESGAVFRYLCRTQKPDDHWYPADFKKQALVEMYLDWHHNGLRGPVTAMVFSKILAPMRNLPPSVDDETGNKNIIDALNKIESVFLVKNKFLAGD